MKNNINDFCTMFIANREALKKAARFDSTFIYPAAANTLTAAGVTADVDKLKETRKILKKSISSISYLRGYSELPILVQLYLSGDAEGAADRIEETYKILKKHFSRSEYLAFLAITVGNEADAAKSEEIGARGRNIYDLMKKEHPILTSQSDSVMAGFMALSEKTDAELITECEKCFELLKKNFSDKDAVQTCAQIFSMADGSAEEKVGKMIQLFGALKEAGRKFDKHSELPILAAVSLCSKDVKTLTDTILEADGFLSKQKGYGALSTDKTTRLAHAAMLTTSFYEEADSKTSSMSMIAVQQAAICAMIACMAAITAANVAAASSSH